MESALEELKEDLENEKTMREKAEKSRRDLNDDLETLRTEYLEAADKTAVSLEIQKKKDEELKELKVLSFIIFLIFNAGDIVTA